MTVRHKKHSTSTGTSWQIMHSFLFSLFVHWRVVSRADTFAKGGWDLVAFLIHALVRITSQLLFQVDQSFFFFMKLFIPAELSPNPSHFSSKNHAHFPFHLTPSAID